MLLYVKYKSIFYPKTFLLPGQRRIVQLLCFIKLVEIQYINKIETC